MKARWVTRPPLSHIEPGALLARGFIAGTGCGPAKSVAGKSTLGCNAMLTLLPAPVGHFEGQESGFPILK